MPDGELALRGIPMFSAKKYAADLSRLGKYKDAVRQWMEGGRRPEDPMLLAMICGETEYILHEVSPELGETYSFLKRYGDDIVMGSVDAVARWQFLHEAGLAEGKFRLSTIGGSHA
jgi:hypothetical protein